MNKILAPIGGWHFFITVFTIILLFNAANLVLFNYCAYFLHIAEYILLISALLIFLPKIIIVFAVFKRFIDIYGNIKKAFGATLFCVISWFLALLILLKPVFNFLSDEYDIAKMFQFQSDSKNMACYWVICFTFLIALTFARSLNYKNKLNVIILLKRTFLIVMIYFFSNVINKPLYLFNWMPVTDFRMIPSIEVKDTLLAYKNFKYEFLKRYDVVTVSDHNSGLFETPMRIIGLPKEKIEIKNNKIYVDNKPLDEQYGFYGEKLMPVKINKTVVLDDNSYFLMGDNRYYTKNGKYLSKNRQTNREEWLDINSNENYFSVSKEKITGKIVAINYFKDKNNIEREKYGIVILTGDKILKFNPSETTTNLFGKNVKQ